jgi:hypothetical protein
LKTTTKENKMTRQYNAKQLAKALAEVDAQIVRMERITDEYETLVAAFPAAVPEHISAAYYAAHHALEALRHDRAGVELNPLTAEYALS